MVIGSLIATAREAAQSRVQYARSKARLKEGYAIMPEIKLVIGNKVGLHARPAALFVQTANKFRSMITVINGKARANAKSILNILTLGAGSGSVVTVIAEGDDAAEALRALEELNAGNFGEDA
jgi:phosphotransferase system HPr (HPr) family protein